MNEFIKLQLDGSRTKIFINDKHFHQCKYLLLSIPIDDMKDWDYYETMDEVIAATNKNRGEQRAGLTPQEAFKGHCSNLQAWVEHGYDTRLLDTKLAIPIIRDILTDLLKSHNIEKSYVYPKDYWKQKFRRFFFQCVESLDDYIKRSLKNEYTHGKFKFLYNVLFRTKDVFFTPEEISGSVALSEMYAHFLPMKQRDNMIRRRSYWERKLFPRTPVVDGEEFMYYVGEESFYTRKDAEKFSKAENLKYRRFLRSIRDSEGDDRKLVSVSDKRDYLPYLYSKGQFTDESNISFLQIDGEVYIRDSEGRYWRES